jgi:hypothetical protein
VRSFYLDITQWARDDPARWGPWAVPCPVKAGEIPHKKTADRRKSRMDQRTREQLPLLPALIAAADSQRKATAERLAAAKAAAPGAVFTTAGQTLRRTATTRASAASRSPGTEARRSIHSLPGGPAANTSPRTARAGTNWARPDPDRMEPVPLPARRGSRGTRAGPGPPAARMPDL